MHLTRNQFVRGGALTALALALPPARGRAGAPPRPRRPAPPPGSGVAGARPPRGPGGGPARLSWERVELRLRHAWTLSRNSSTSKRNVVVRIEQGGIIGMGEAAPNIRFGESADTVEEALRAAAPIIASEHPSRLAPLTRRLAQALPRAHAARCAVDLALWDWNGKALGIPLWRQLGLDPGACPLSSFSISIAGKEEIANKVREAAPYPLLKIKLGARGAITDREIVETVRREAPKKRLRVDPNEGWTPEEARAQLRWLAGLRDGDAPVVELCEQPLPAGDLAALQALHRERPPMPVLLDESVLGAEDIPRLAGVCDGIVIKLQKAGGITGALQQIAVARALGMKVMLGCMIESSLGITAAAHLAPLVDYADLDGHLLIDDDPFRGARVAAGRISLPDGAGLGVAAAADRAM